MSKDAATNLLVGVFWLVAAQQRWEPWVERVPSKLNPADTLSRDEFNLAAEFKASVVHVCCQAAAQVLLEAVAGATGDFLTVATSLTHALRSGSSPTETTAPRTAVPA